MYVYMICIIKNDEHNHMISNTITYCLMYNMMSMPNLPQRKLFDSRAGGDGLMWVRKTFHQRTNETLYSFVYKYVIIDENYRLYLVEVITFIRDIGL